MRDQSMIRAHEDEAAQYDEQVKHYEYHVHDVLFGMCFEFIKTNERLLDVGIGTGLGSLPFARAGLQVFGFDASAKMLKVCEGKAFARELKIFDLRDTPYPYPQGCFDHVISHGVFHFFGELGKIVKEVARVLRWGGIFAFTVAAESSLKDERTDTTSKGYARIPTSWGVDIFAHSDEYITRVLRDSGLEKLKMQKVLIRGGEKGDEDLLFKVYVAHRK